MASTQTLTIDRVEWSADLEALLLAAADGDIDEIRLQVGQGAQVFDVRREGKRLAAFVLRVDWLTTGPQGVVVVAAGDGEGIDLTRTVLPHIERMFGPEVKSMRIHTKRPGLVRKLVREGYGKPEWVLTKELNHGRQEQ